MTVEELKEAADKLGYNIIKKHPYERFEPCVCGGSSRFVVHSYEKGKWSIAFECKKCHRRIYGDTEADAKLNWNNELRRIKNDREQG